MSTLRQLGQARTPMIEEVARFLGRRHAQPELLLAVAIGFAIMGGALLAVSGVAPGLLRALPLVAAALCVQGRRVCGRLEVMVAREDGHALPSNAIWAALADRFCDIFLFVGAGYAAFGVAWDAGPALGWTIAVLTLLTAYGREFGGRLGFPIDVSEDVAMRRRMNALTALCLIAALEPFWGGHGVIMLIGLIVIAAGVAWVFTARVRGLARQLSARG